MRPLSILLATAFTLLAAARPARAVTPPCDSLTNPIYIQMGSMQVDLILRLARALRDTKVTLPSGGTTGVTLVWVSSGTCTNIDNFYHHTAPITANMSYVPSTAEDPNWTPASPALTCTPPAGLFPDIANAATFISSCTPDSPPATVTVENGSVLPYIIAVPKASTQTAITAEEAYFVFGFGGTGKGDVMPWLDDTEIFIRPTTKSTLLTWAANLTIPADKVKGVSVPQSQAVITDLVAAADPNAAIGLLSTGDYETQRAVISELAFRAFHQYAAYYPDSTSTSRDKKNVRDGHYTVWAPTEWMYNTDGSGNAVKPDARYVVDMIAGKEVTPAPDFDPNVFAARVGLVPDCAMRVQRPADGAPLSVYKPSASCTCSFEAAVDTTQCATCDANNPCASGVCRRGYCEEF